MIKDLEDESELSDYDLKINQVVIDCYEAIAWFDNNTRFKIMTELIRRFKIDEVGLPILLVPSE